MVKLNKYLYKIKPSIIFDFLFFNIAFFLIIFAWTNFLIRQKIFSLILTLTIVAGLNIIKIIYNKFFGKKNNKNDTKNKDNDLYMLSLISNSQEENQQLFLKILTKNEPQKTNLYNFIKFKNDKNKAICFDFTSLILKQENALKLILFAKNNNIDELIILCCQCPSKDKLFYENLKDIKIKIFEKDEICSNFFSKSNIYPEKKFEPKNIEKIRFKNLVKISLDRNKSKNYFISGLLIFFCSLIVRYNIYYVIISSLMFFLSIISRQNKKEASKDFF